MFFSHRERSQYGVVLPPPSPLLSSKVKGYSEVVPFSAGKEFLALRSLDFHFFFAPHQLLTSLLEASTSTEGRRGQLVTLSSFSSPPSRVSPVFYRPTDR